MKFREDFLSLKNTKALQGIAAIAIIFHHLAQEITDYGAVWKGPITYMNGMGILFTSIFFFFSGYGLLKSYRTKPGYLHSFLGKRLPTVVIPFLVSNFIYLVFIGFYTGKVVRVTDTLTCLSGLTLLNTNSWFLVEIIIFYLVFYAIYKQCKNQNKAFGLMAGFVLCLIVLSLFLGHDGSELNGHWFMGEWWYNSTVTFLCGMLVAKHEEKIIAFAKKNYCWLLPITMVAFVGMYILAEYVVKNVGYYCEWEGHPGYAEKAITLAAQTPACILFVAVILLLCMKIRWHNPVTDFIGKISLELYLIHGLMMQVVRYMFGEIEDGRFIFMVLLYSFLAATVLCFCVDGQLIGLWRLAKENNRRVPETLEAKENLRKRKERKKKLKNVFIIIGLVLAVLVVKEAYDKYIVPELNYKEEVERLATIQVGEEIYFGYYDTEPGNFDERIEWIVVDKKDDMVLLVAVEGMIADSYQNEYEAVNWEQSDIRAMLNEVFYKEAFTEKEQALIVTTQIVTKDNPLSGTDGGNDTYDKVFLLSTEEAEKYFAGNEERKLMPTEMAFRQEINFNSNQRSSWWWLRNPGEQSNMMAVISVKGEVDYKGESVQKKSGAVRPAIWVKCK